MHTQTVEFPSEGQTIRGDLITPAPGSPCILMSHGFEASKDGAKWSFLTPRLVDRGYTVLKFNYRGCGYGSDASDGLFEDTTLSARIADYRAASASSRPPMSTRTESPSLAQASVVKFPSPPKTLGSKPTSFSPPPPDPKHPPKNSSPSAGPPVISLSPRERGSQKRISRMGERYDLCSAATKLDRPTLIIHGSLDDDVPVEQARELYAHAREPKRLEIFEGAEHALRRPEDMQSILELSLGWLEAYCSRSTSPSSSCTGPARSLLSPCAGPLPATWKAFPERLHRPVHESECG